MQCAAAQLRAQQARAHHRQLQREARERFAGGAAPAGPIGGIAQADVAGGERGLARRVGRLELCHDEELPRRRAAGGDRGARHELARGRAGQQLMGREERCRWRRSPDAQLRAVGDEREERAAGRVGCRQRRHNAGARDWLVEAADQALQQ
jgi:hypothetical protein